MKKVGKLNLEEFTVNIAYTACNTMLGSDLLTSSTIKRYQGDVPSPVRVTVCPRKIVSIPLNEMKPSSTENCICAILQLADVAQDYQKITFLKNSNYRKTKTQYLKVLLEIYLKAEKEWHFHSVII